MNLQEFMESKAKNIWVNEGRNAFYVRKGKHVINKEVQNTLDLANIDVAEEETLQTAFEIHNFINLCEQTAKDNNLTFYVENVLNPKLEGYLKRRKYESDNNMPAPSFSISFSKPSVQTY